MWYRSRGIPALAGGSLLLVMGVAVTGCGGEPGSRPSSPATAGSASPAGAVDPTPPAEPDLPEPEHHELTLAWEGAEREYRLDVPDSYQSDEPTPLVLVLHGGQSTAAGIRIQSRMADFAHQHGVLVAYPQGERQVWTANPEARGPDDVGFLTALVDELVAEWNAAPGQVYAAGWSNGAEMSYRLAVAAPEVFAAVAPIAGNFIRPPDALEPAAPVSVVGFIGLADRAVADGSSLELWRDLLDCQPGEPATVAGAANVTRTDAECRDGSEVVEYRLDGVGHVWPNRASHGFSANDAIWEFFSTHARTG